MNRKIAILSDIHGNLNALKAVISAAEKEGVNEYWLLGDILLPGPGSKDLLELLYQLPITVKIKGNWDDCFLEVLDVSNIDDATDIYLARLSQYLCETLSKDDIEFLRNMPTRVKNTINGVNFSLTHNQIEKNWGGALIPNSEQINFDHLFDKDTDVAIYYGNGNWNNLEAIELVKARIMLLASPEYLKDNPIEKPEDLAGKNLIHVCSSTKWKQMVDHLKLDMDIETGPMFGTTSMGIQAAKHGQGVVVANRMLAQDEIEEGSVVEPLMTNVYDEKAFYVVYPPQMAESTKVKCFVDWITEEIKNSYK